MILANKIYLKLKSTISYVKLKIMLTFNFEMKKYCPACNQKVPDFYFFSYRPYGCPNCNASPRERFVMYCFRNNLLPSLHNGFNILHIAPSEKSIENYFRSFGNWVGGDINPKRYNKNVIHLDLEKFHINDYFDVIYASHVLEHIIDDYKAMKNIYNHLVPGGFAIILVPLLGKATIEGGPSLSPKERQKKFGQHDHVRQYGSDITERLESVGFSVKIIDSKNISLSEIKKFGFETHGYKGNEEYEKVFMCQREA